MGSINSIFYCCQNECTSAKRYLIPPKQLQFLIPACLQHALPLDASTSSRKSWTELKGCTPGNKIIHYTRSNSIMHAELIQLSIKANHNKCWNNSFPESSNSCLSINLACLANNPCIQKSDDNQIQNKTKSTSTMRGSLKNVGKTFI